MYAVLADIHGNMHAFKKVLDDMKMFDIQGVILLGNLIDYGLQSNEVVGYIRDELGYRIVCNIWGNHERAIMLEDFSGFHHKEVLIVQNTRRVYWVRLQGSI